MLDKGLSKGLISCRWLIAICYFFHHLSTSLWISDVCYEGRKISQLEAVTMPTTQKEWAGDKNINSKC